MGAMDGAAAWDLPVRERWFVAEPVDDDVVRFLEPAVHPFLRANCWLVRGRDRDLLVDAGLGVASLRDEVLALTGREPVVWVTHGHYDHVGGAHEFTQRWVHAAEAPALASPVQDSLVTAELDADFQAALAADSPDGPPALLVDARPTSAYDPTSYRVRPAPATRTFDDGDVVDLGDRRLTVLHLPGHTPGSAALLETETGLLFSGDVVYDGELLDELEESSIPDYVASMRQLLSAPVRRVHAGHEPSFDGERLQQLCEAYLTRRP